MSWHIEEVKCRGYALWSGGHSQMKLPLEVEPRGGTYFRNASLQGHYPP